MPLSGSYTFYVQLRMKIKPSQWTINQYFLLFNYLVKILIVNIYNTKYFLKYYIYLKSSLRLADT